MGVRAEREVLAGAPICASGALEMRRTLVDPPTGYPPKTTPILGYHHQESNITIRKRSPKTEDGTW